MKKIKYFALASILAFGMSGCGDFGDTNIDPEHLNEGNVPYAMLFSNAQHQVLGSDWDVWRNGCIYSGQWMQHLTSINWWWSYNLFAWNNDYSGAYWSTYNSDRGAFRDVTTVVDKWADDDEYVIDYNMARVLRVYAASRMTDLYGDVPYSEAGRPALYSYPVYDTQESIYKDMLNELNDAQSHLSSGTAVMGKQDLYFNGDAASWKRFANSLMLRLAMRLSKVDQATAKEYVNKAFSNGLITSNDQNVMLYHTDGVTTNDSSEPYAKIFSHEDYEFFLSEFFVDMLKDTDDPRLALIATVCEHPSNDIQGSSYEYGDSTPSIQQGLPSGWNDGPSSAYYIGKYDSRFLSDGSYITAGTSYESYFSVPNRYTYAEPTSPTFIVTYAQTQLLLAEAAYRGWVSGSAEEYYEEGVRAAMEQFSLYKSSGAASLYSKYLTDDAIDEYLENNPYDAGNALEQINTQYYINCFCDEYETFANWRRSGYPELTAPSNAAIYGESASDGTIPRRFRYPNDESQVNSTNYNSAVANLSNGDKFNSRMWWDKQ